SRATAAGCALVFCALEIQARWVEEPVLARVHGAAYGDYAARTGRFVPVIGRVRDVRVADLAQPRRVAFDAGAGSAG
ncbi:MAG: hypothetical protein ACRDU0_18715, partial [Mycobacterium sp.]